VAKQQPPKDKSLPIPEDDEPAEDIQFDDDEPMLFDPNQADDELDHSASAGPSRRTQVEEV